MKEKYPLNLPIGSVRAILALIITFGYLVGLLFLNLNSEILAALSTIEGMVLGYYFGTRQSINTASFDKSKKSVGSSNIINEDFMEDTEITSKFSDYGVNPPKVRFDIDEAESHLQPITTESKSNIDINKFKKIR